MLSQKTNYETQINKIFVDHLGFTTLTTANENSRSNKENLPPPIQMQLSQTPKTFCCKFIAFLKSMLDF